MAGDVLIQPPEPPPAPPGEDPRDEPIPDDLGCIRCSYNLRGLCGDGRCPECGLAVLSTLRHDAVLSNSDVQWIERLRLGTYLLAAAMMVWGVAAFAASHADSGAHFVSFLVSAGPRSWPLPLALPRHAWVVQMLLVPYMAAAALFVAGVWCVGAQEPAAVEVEREAMTSRRVLLALAGAIPVLAALFWFAAPRATGWVADSLFHVRAWPAWAALFALLDLAVHVLLFGHLLRLASRVLDAALVRETRWLSRGATAALACIAAGCVAMIEDPSSSTLIVLGSLLLMPVGIGLLILMFAFARAFRDAAAAGRAGEQTPYAVRAAGGR